jgi:pimeloyl-ACP methyl ester carboxylesterase
VAYLARHFRVLVFDPRGKGRSDRPPDPAAHGDSELVEDAVAVLDATGTPAAICVSLSTGAGALWQLAATHPERVAGTVFVGAQPSRPPADALGCRVGWIANDGHCVPARHPVRLNVLLRRFVESVDLDGVLT